jgi:hypothetical protein
LKLNNKKVVPVVAIPLVALILLVAAMMSAGAAPTGGIHVPPGAIVDSPNARMANDTAPRPVPAAPQLPTAAQPGAVTETFDGGPLDAWQGISDASVNWVASEGRLQEDLPITQGPSEDQALFVTKDTGFANGTIEAEFYPTAGSPVGMVVRGSDHGYYNIVLNMNVSTNTVSKAQIERVTPAGTEVIATAPFSSYPGYNLEQWQDLLVSAQGNTITVSVGGNQIMSATDTGSSALSSGWAGVWTLADRGASFDNIRIQRNAGR